MLNIFSILFGLVGLVIAIIGFVPFLGLVNWIGLPFVAFGALLGLISRSSSGLYFCLIVAAISVFRLWLGGGIF